MTAAYELALLGQPTKKQVAEIEDAVSGIISLFGLELRNHVAWSVQPSTFQPSQTRTAAALFFGGKGVPIGAASTLAAQAIPVIPVVSSLTSVSNELPESIRAFGAIPYSAGPKRIAVALLECAGLLPRQRRVFVSYRRDEARSAALQLFDAFSARLYDVFLDTHGVAPGDDFQEVLWHRLCDSDVLVMLDTPTYFGSRWTAAEFGRALAKGISVLSVGWPAVTPSPRTSTSTRVDLLPTEIDSRDGSIAPSAIERICEQLEAVRSESIAVRRLNLVSTVAIGLERIRGKVVGLGLGNGIYLELADGRRVVVYPAVGVPTSKTLHEAVLLTPNEEVAVVYDHIGLSEDWLQHLSWLGKNIAAPRWMKAAEVAWDLAGWESRK